MNDPLTEKFLNDISTNSVEILHQIERVESDIDAMIDRVVYYKQNPKLEDLNEIKALLKDLRERYS